ncbi:uncharacterized protein LOC128739432 [Sabethes cyaneus]|uniref:uncharacterized protein LOC128739432 n=1 Tax=Sabethes cyaneus TaxID=53552 RepID=UPI00237E93DA|nr:uncharacterized protein LOC128739432 [Sabethes cyaneus]
MVDTNPEIKTDPTPSPTAYCVIRSSDFDSNVNMLELSSQLFNSDEIHHPDISCLDSDTVTAVRTSSAATQAIDKADDRTIDLIPCFLQPEQSVLISAKCSVTPPAYHGGDDPNIFDAIVFTPDSSWQPFNGDLQLDHLDISCLESETVTASEANSAAKQNIVRCVSISEPSRLELCAKRNLANNILTFRYSPQLRCKGMLQQQISLEFLPGEIIMKLCPPIKRSCVTEQLC